MTTPTPDANLDDTRWGAAVRWRDPLTGKHVTRRRTGLTRDEAVAFLRTEGRERCIRRTAPVSYTLWEGDALTKSGRYWPRVGSKAIAISSLDPNRERRETDLAYNTRLRRNDDGLPPAFKIPGVWYPAGIRRPEFAT